MTRRESLRLLGLASLLAIPRLAEADTALEAVRSQPILDGQGAGGMKLGDSDDAVARVLGRAPDRRNHHSNVALRRDLYEIAPPDRERIFVFALAYGLGEAGVGAIRGAAMRRQAGPLPYSGRTRRGYGLDDGAQRLQALYGRPDAEFRFSSFDPPYAWYRAAGLAILPVFQADYRVAQFIVLAPNLSQAEARRFVMAE